MKTTTNHIDNSTHPTVNGMAANGHDAGDKMVDVNNNTVDNLNEQDHQIKEVQERWFPGIRQYVQAHPVSFLGFVLAGGYLVSRVLSNR